MAGPSLGGVLVGTAGAGIAFGINAASYGVVIVCLCLMRTKEMTLSPLVARQKGQLREGIRYVVGRRDLVIAMLVIAVVNSFAMNFQLTVALISREALGLSASAYGVLFGAVGAGSICGALLAARRRRPRMRVVVVAAVALGVLEICCSLASGFWVLLVLLFVVGACSLSVSNSTNAIVQLGAAPALRGRVLSLYFLSVSGGRPVGGFVLGLIASLAGPSWPMGIGGLIAMLSGLGAALWLMARRRSQTT
jgi:MFS family permease